MSIGDEIYDLLLRFREGRRNPAGLHIYHYTTAQGAAGIFASRAIWLFDSREMRDDHELVYGNGLIRDALTLASRTSPRISPLRTLAGELLPILADQEQKGLTYIGCFTEQHENGEAWEKFANHGTGFCLQIPWAVVASPLWAPGEVPVIRSVVYSRQAQEDLVQEFVTLLAACTDDDRATVTDVARLLATEAMACWKRPSYAAEREWRILRFRQGRALDGTFDGRGYLNLHPADPVTVTAVYAGPHTSNEDRAAIGKALRANPEYSHLSVS